MDYHRHTRFYRHEPLHQSGSGKIRLQQRRIGFLAHEFCSRHACRHSENAGRHICHAVLENPSQPQRHRRSGDVVPVLCRYPPATGNRRNLKLHLVDFFGRILIFDFKRTDCILYAGNIGIRLYRCRPTAKPFVQRRTRNCRIGRLGRRSDVGLGVFTGTRIVPAWRTGLAGRFLPVGNQRRHVGGLGDADRLAFLICRGITLLGRYRAVRNHRPTLHDPRL